MNKLSKGIVLISAAALTLGLAACGSSTNSDAGHVYFLNNKPEVVDQWNELADMYTKETGVQVDIQSATSGSYESTLSSELAKNNAPTMFGIGGFDQYAKYKNYLEPLQDSEAYKLLNEQGKQMHKSAGNGVEPSEIIKDYGADIIRLWVASSDYTVDVRAGKNIFKQLSEAYRKIRNTFRYLLGNLADFDPAKDTIAYQDMTDLDKWALLRLEQVFEEVTDAYENYQFHVMYHAIHNFCTVDLSAMYLDVIKDRLYTEKADSHIRRSAQSAMYIILDTLVKIVAPVLSFTAEEVWQNMPAVEGKEESVLLTDWPKAHKEYLDADLDARWAQFLSYRRDLTRVLEGARKEHKIGHALDAAVTIYADGEDYDFLSQWQDQLATLLIVSEAKLVKGEAPAEAVAGEDHGDMKVVVAPSTAEKCERCWIHSDTVGSDPNHPTLCARCAAVLSE